MKAVSRFGTILTIAVVATVTACSGGEESIEPEVGQGWQLVWNDEFSGDQIDATKWSYETNCWGGGNNEQQCYTDRPENSFLRDGALVIHAQEETFTGPAEPTDWVGSNPDDTATLPYTSARLRTLNKGDFTYGRIEVRAQLPGGQGLWPAIWMLPSGSTYGDWAASGEIDIMEAVNLGTTEELPVHGTLHYGGVFPANTYSGTRYVFDGADPRDDFHTYAIEWSDSEIRWYVDGVHYATQTKAGWFSAPADGDVLTGGPPFDQRFHLLLNVAVGGAWPGDPDSSTVLPQEMAVDYVRVFSCPASPTTLDACATTSPDAEAVAGNQPPDLIDVPYDPDFITKDVVTVFDDEVVGPYALDVAASSGDVETSFVDDPERGPVTRLAFNTDEAVAYYQSAEGFDFSGFASLEFDLKIEVDPRSSGGYAAKMDCFYPCGSGDYPIDLPADGQWHHFSIPLPDLVTLPGSSLDLTTVNTPLVVFPDWGAQDGVVLLVDDVQVVR